MTTTAENIQRRLQDLPHVREARLISRWCVAAIENEAAGDVKVFNGFAEDGWRLGAYLPNDDGHLLIFVPIRGGDG